MKKFMVIGLGNFGGQVARTLFEIGHEVVAIDNDRERIEELADFTSRALIADAADRGLLEANGAGEMDAVIVSLGPNISKAILTIMFLKELKVRHVIVKANDSDEARAMRKVGADQVIFPEQEVAVKLARKLTSPSVLDTIDLAGEYIMSEILTPMEFVGQSLIELDLRRKYDVFVIAIREAVPERFTVLPQPGYRLKDSDVMILLGKGENIARIERKANQQEG